MTLAAIYNVYDSEELLEGSIRQIRKHIDVVIVVYQTVSNWGETYTGGKEECERLLSVGLIDHIIPYSPNIGNERLSGCRNETEKRKIGLAKARQIGCTHFLFMDADEYYFAEQFAKAKHYIDESGHSASVCKIQAYNKFPELALRELEGYHVPFIHRISDGLKIGFQPYPYYSDPTRTTNHTSSFLFDSERIVMHHYTNIRNDIERKYRNSSAKHNFNINNLLHDFAQVTLEDSESCILVPNYFGINVVSNSKTIQEPVQKPGSTVEN